MKTIDPAVDAGLAIEKPNQRKHRELPSTSWLILLLGSLSAFGPLSIDTYLPALPELQHEFGASASLAQLTLSACLVGLASGQLIAGPLSDRFGRRRPLLVGLVCFALASLACALSPSIFALIGARLVQGAAGGAGVVIARATVRDLFEGTEAARFFSRLMMVTGVAPILAPIVGGQLLRFTDWRGVFVFLALVGVVLLVAATLFLPETLSEDRRKEGGVLSVLTTFGSLIRDRAFFGYALTMGFAGAALFGYIASSPFVMQEIHGLSEQTFSFVFGSIAIGLIVSSQINARLVSRYQLQSLLFGGLTMMATGGVALLVGIVLDWGLIGLLIPLYVMIGSVGFILPNSTALALSDHPKSAGTAGALLGLMQFMFGAIAAPLVGIAGDETALPMGVVIATTSIAALAAFLLLAKQKSQ